MVLLNALISQKEQKTKGKKNHKQVWNVPLFCTLQVVGNDDVYVSKLVPKVGTSFQTSIEGKEKRI